METLPAMRADLAVGTLQHIEKTPPDVLQWGLLSDSYRIFTINAFAILVKCITFVYQIVTVVNSRWIATELK